MDTREGRIPPLKRSSDDLNGRGARGVGHHGAPWAVDHFAPYPMSPQTTKSHNVVTGLWWNPGRLIWPGGWRGTGRRWSASGGMGCFSMPRLECPRIMSTDLDVSCCKTRVGTSWQLFRRLSFSYSCSEGYREIFPVITVSLPRGEAEMYVPDTLKSTTSPFSMRSYGSILWARGSRRLSGALLVNHILFSLTRVEVSTGTLVGDVRAGESRLHSCSQGIASVGSFRVRSLHHSSWYPSKHAHGKTCRTWSYAVVRPRCASCHRRCASAAQACHGPE